jgi:hypothetical protein
MADLAAPGSVAEPAPGDGLEPTEVPELFIPRRSASPQGRPAPGTPGARPSAFRLTGAGPDRTRAEECLTAAIYYEAANEPTAGQEAVAQVILNRMRHPSYPKSVCGVVYQGSERRTGCQFTFTCDGSLNRRPSTSGWARAGVVARRALSGHVAAEVSAATHYHTRWISPYWSPSLIRLGEVGAHVFYRMPGSAAERPYGGGETLVVRTSGTAGRQAPGRPQARPAAKPSSASAFTVWGLTVEHPGR